MPHVIQADDLTAHYGTHDCRRLRQHIFSDLSPMAFDLALRYARTAELSSYEQANQELLAIHERLRVNDLNLCADTKDLKNTAKRCAEKCRSARQQAESSPDAYQACLKIVDHYGITPPPTKDDNQEPALNRLCCSQWWFRKIKTLRLRTIEAIARNIELVNRCRSAYATVTTP